MNTRKVTLDPGLTLAPLFDVPVRDEGWNGFPVPLLTAEQCLELSAWIAAEGGTLSYVVRDGAVWGVDTEDPDADEWPLVDVDVDGVCRYDLGGLTWSLAEVYTDEPTDQEWTEQRDFGAVRFASKRAMWVDREAWSLASRNATPTNRHPHPDAADYARADALVPPAPEEAPDA